VIPRKAGERVKTDRRDSLMLARLHRAGELTAVWGPDDAQEGLRDLTRAREDMKHLQRQTFVCLSASIWQMLQRKEQLDSGALSMA
jgi:transposase